MCSRNDLCQNYYCCFRIEVTGVFIEIRKYPGPNFLWIFINVNFLLLLALCIFRIHIVCVCVCVRREVLGIPYATASFSFSAKSVLAYSLDTRKMYPFSSHTELVSPNRIPRTIFCCVSRVLGIWRFASSLYRVVWCAQSCTVTIRLFSTALAVTPIKEGETNVFLIKWSSDFAEPSRLPNDGVDVWFNRSSCSYA